LIGPSGLILVSFDFYCPSSMILLGFDFCESSGLILIGFDFLFFIVSSSCLSLCLAWDYGVQTSIGLKLFILLHNYEIYVFVCTNIY
jgi:hypothetical protein